MQFSVASELSLRTVQSVVSDLKCHFSSLTELISLGLPPKVCPPAQTQPFRLLSQVEGKLSLGHHTGSTWNYTTSCEAHERGNLSVASGL